MGGAGFEAKETQPRKGSTLPAEGVRGEGEGILYPRSKDLILTLAG